MSKLSDNLPVGMDECYRNGLYGNCGIKCQKLLRGECDSANNYDKYISFKDGDYMFVVIRDSFKTYELDKISDGVVEWWVVKVDGFFVSSEGRDNGDIAKNRFLDYVSAEIIVGMKP